MTGCSLYIEKYIKNAYYSKTVADGIDREQVTQLEFTVKALDGGVPQRSASASVLLTVADVNDNNPVFNPNFYSCEVPYNDETGIYQRLLKAGLFYLDCMIKPLAGFGP